MSATFDATTTGEYDAATTAAARSAAIVAALTGTISVKVFDGSNVEKGSGTMASPWATASGDTVTVGEVSSFTVGATGTPDANWYIRFQNVGATRWVRGSFGLAGSGQDFTWSLSTWTATQTGTIGTATIICTGNTAPVFTVAPTTSTVASTGGTIQFTAVDPDGSSVIYSLTTTRNGVTINSNTGLVTVTSAASGTSGNIVAQASDGLLTASTTCYVTVGAVLSDTPDYVDPVSTVSLLSGRTTIYAGPTSIGTGSGTSAGNAMSLTMALANAAEKQTIQLISETYSDNYTLSKSFAADSALIVKGAANFTSTATGTWTMTGARQIVTGVQFSGNDAKMRIGGLNNKAIGNKFTDWGNGQAVSALRSGSKCEIAYNEIYNPSDWVEGESSYPLRIGVRTQDDGAADFHYDGWLHHNWFHDFPAKPNAAVYGSGQSDAIEIGEDIGGTYPNVNSGWYMEYNLIQDHLQTSAGSVDFKVGGVVARYNSFDNVLGRMDIRGGSMHGCTIESNYLGTSSTAGMVLHGKNSRIIGNYVPGNLGICVSAGNQELVTPSLGNGYTPCEDTLVVGNIGALKVGHVFSGVMADFPADGTTIRDHTGSITLGAATKPSSSGTYYATGTTNNSGSAAGINFSPAAALLSSQVGPSAISLASAQYKAARGL